MMITNKTQEALVILQEECAEVIQAVSKCYRFGLDNQHKSGATQRANLEMEIGDMLALVDILVDQGVIDLNNLQTAKLNKVEKLKKWSSLYETESI
jgi:NTP pyrophosphatase (non-canonical NTP hydrolase)